MARGVFDTCILPSALTPDNCDVFIRALEEAKPEIFSPGNTKIRLESSNANGGPGEQVSDVVADDEEVGRVLQKHLRYQGDTFIFLFQNHSWAPFNLSRAALRQIVTAVGPHPEFLRLFRGFGEPPSGYQTDFSGGYSSHTEVPCDTSSSPSCTSTEEEPRYSSGFMYTLRYMAANGRSQCPWSDRRIGVYHMRNAMRNASKSVWVVLQPTVAALELPRAVPAGSHQHDPTRLHVLLLRSILPAWTAYLTYLDTCENKHQAFTGSQDIQYYSDLLHNAILELKSNMEILAGLQRMGASHGGGNKASADHGLDTCVSQFRTNLSWAEDMLDRTKEASTLMALLHYSQRARELAFDTSNMNHVANATKADQDTMLLLARAAKKDSEIMKLIAFVSVVYLPCSLITALFSTGFVTVSLTGGATEAYDTRRALTQAAIYAVLAAALTILTGTVVYILRRRTAVRA
ncbi:hypothetical protein B0T16DRAFT_458677 [Cercophora newfieldiana]|uniref:CorA-like transporter domain-containing protein n=1 Tax=Cercophora newfieldiana TaxID=92897 RepID=A0AA40CRG7_9PEZI|nr:hypothetical protein B0T16DRAFT_458677 [Cercophora newfieldiana]